MSRLPPVDESQLPEDLAALFARRRREGYLPNSYLTLAHRPAVLRAYAQLTEAVYREGVVAPELKSLVATVRSAAAGCRYCQAHTASHATYRHGTDTRRLDAVWDFETSDLFSDAERAALRLARDAAQTPNSVTDEHFSDLRKHFSVAEIVELLAVISQFAFMNTWNDSLATELEEVPRRHAEERLSSHGWEVGKHGASDEWDG